MKESKIGDIVKIECGSLYEAELTYADLKRQGCWEVYKPIKIVWSWKKLSHIAMFQVIKTEYREPITIVDVMQKALEVADRIRAARRLSANRT